MSSPQSTQTRKLLRADSSYKNPEYFRGRAMTYYQLGDSKACEDWQQAKALGDKKADFFLKKYCTQ